MHILNPIFKRLRILKFENTIKLQIGKAMHLYKNLLPESFNDMFLLYTDVHMFYARAKNSFRLPYSRTNVRKFFTPLSRPLTILFLFIYKRVRPAKRSPILI